MKVNTSKLLINEPPLLVMPSLAARIGLNEAILLQQIHYWLGRSPHQHGGRVWFYRTASEWVSELSFWSDSTIKRTLASLEASSLIVSAKLHRELMNDPYTRTKWYTINYDQLESLNLENASGQNDQMASSQNDQFSSGQNDQMLQENTTENTTESTDGGSADADHQQQPVDDRMNYQVILDAYHEILPEMAEVRVLTDTRKKTIRNFWKKFKFNQERWEAYLRYIGKHCRWMLEDRPNGRDGFWKRKNLDYLVTERCYVAVKEERANDR
ncbi:replication protein [Serratia sp. D1N4]